ncbi:MAG TPA: ROK family protein [Bacteroidales bacterium]|nr:ROK family protein [Bacteroidales bacterium]HPT11935.1 ROK family protein [Bacteroidales bacterium]
MYSHAAAIGIDIGRFSLRTAVVRYDGRLLLRESFPLSDVLTKKNIVSSIESALWRTRELAALQNINPIAVGISSPGYIDHENGMVLGPDHGIRGWKNVPLATLIGKSSGLPVYVGNDANLMTVAEHRFGAAKGYSHVVFIALRNGIGGGIIINGKLYRGVNDTGGEIGMMIISLPARDNDNITSGTLEFFASAGALVKSYLAEKGEDGNNAVSLRARNVFDLCLEGDTAARKAVNENAHFVGVGLANLISIFAPEIIVIGGGMAMAGDYYIKEIRNQTFANLLSYCAKGLKIVPASLGSDSSVIGAAWYALTRLDGKRI